MLITWVALISTGNTYHSNLLIFIGLDQKYFLSNQCLVLKIS